MNLPKEVTFYRLCLSRSNGGGGKLLYIRNKAEALGCKAQRLCIHIARRQYKKYSDDGEPQGTAGVPVLDVLEKSDVKDVCVVATRYFGGILLGGGGLVRAYSHTAKIALDSGVIVTMAKCDELCVLSDYNYYGKLASLIPENGGTVISADFADNVKVKFSIPCEKSDNIKNLIVDTSNGRFLPKNRREICRNGNFEIKRGKKQIFEYI